MSTRREQLRNVSFDQNSTNAGLWLDKYIKDSTSEAQDKAKLVDEVASIKAPEIYEKAFNRWEAFMKTEAEAHRAKIGYATVVGRMAVGHGDDAVLETSVALHRTYGVPYIPGSALKGTAASFARNHLNEADWGKNSEAYKVLFGTDKVAGYVTFHDGLLKPSSGKSLHADVLTPHHSDYYMTRENPPPPADWDNPVPVPFLSATGTYLIALSAPPGCDEWLDEVLAILKLALSEQGIGIGAKTSSGYGRMRFVTPPRARELPAPTAQLQPPTEVNEEVTLESEVKENRRAQVRVASGAIVTCADFPSTAYGRPRKGNTCRALVTYEGEKAVSAKYQK